MQESNGEAQQLRQELEAVITKQSSVKVCLPSLNLSYEPAPRCLDLMTRHTPLSCWCAAIVLHTTFAAVSVALMSVLSDLCQRAANVCDVNSIVQEKWYSSVPGDVAVIDRWNHSHVVRCDVKFIRQTHNPSEFFNLYMLQCSGRMW